MSTKSSDGLAAGVFVQQLGQAIREIPLKYRPPLLVLTERLGHWFHLQNEAARLAREVAEDLQLENHCLRFDLEVTRRERDEFERALEAQE